MAIFKKKKHHCTGSIIGKYSKDLFESTLVIFLFCYRYWYNYYSCSLFQWKEDKEEKGIKVDRNKTQDIKCFQFFSRQFIIRAGSEELGDYVELNVKVKHYITNE